MLRKLWKHEWLASYRVLTALHLVLLAMGLIGFLVLRAFGDGRIGGVIGGIYGMLFVLVLAACAIGTHFIMISRYYRNFFTTEGYLVHTLPVSTSAKLLSKILNYLVWALLDGLCIILTCMMLAGPGFVELCFQRGLELLPVVAEAMGFSTVPGMMGALILLLFAALCHIILTFYASISIGSYFQNHKILGSVCSFLVLNILSQVLMVVGMITTLSKFMFINTWEMGPERQISVVGSAIHLPPAELSATLPVLLGIIVLIYAILGAIFYIISYYILKRKLTIS